MTIRDVEQALEEVIDLTLEVKQARWKIGPSDELQRALRTLCEDCDGWSQRLAGLASARGGDLMIDVGTTSIRATADLFPGEVTHDALVAFFVQHLEAEAALARAHAETCRGDDVDAALLLDEIASGLDRNRNTIAALA
jgi:hypothetical protein